MEKFYPVLLNAYFVFARVQSAANPHRPSSFISIDTVSLLYLLFLDLGGLVFIVVLVDLEK